MYTDEQYLKWDEIIDNCITGQEVIDFLKCEPFYLTIEPFLKEVKGRIDYIVHIPALGYALGESGKTGDDLAVIKNVAQRAVAWFDPKLWEDKERVKMLGNKIVEGRKNRKRQNTPPANTGAGGE